MEYYDATAQEVIKEFRTAESGLTSSQAQNRLKEHGKNILIGKEKVSPFKVFLEQFNSPVVWILIGALVVSFIMGEKIDAIVIMSILVINATLGFFQEYRAEKEIEALKRLVSLNAVVIRDGIQREIDSSELVPGDIIIVKEGDKVPADARVFEEIELEAQESMLTGESLPVKKTAVKLPSNQELAEQRNMLFSGTTLTRGKGRAVVVRTGMGSEIGRITKLIQETQKERTPLQEKLTKLGGMLSIIIAAVCGLVLLTGALRGENLVGVFSIAVALAVAAIPEGLPAVVTISLAVGLKRMLRSNALIRKLPSVETLGSTTVICTDKTGTLTYNEMTVKKLFVNDKVIEVSGSGYSTAGEFSEDPQKFALLLKIGALCNDARITDRKFIGDPTEGCLKVAAEKAGIDTEELHEEHPRLNEIPFSSERKRMTTVHRVGDKYYAYMKGAPDVILDLCRSYLSDEKIFPMKPEFKERAEKINAEFCAEAMRVLGFAYKEIESPKNFKETDEINFIFAGMQGMIDPPRDEVRKAVKECHEAGVKVVMITGDYQGTAAAIADAVGIKGRCVTGKELEGMDDETFENAVKGISIYARVNPEHKQKIVKALQKRGEVVAMTGDGVNDAPALKRADIGIAMGITGTDVSKEAADMILTDDNFTSIVRAVEEGRGVYDNIKKFFVFLLSGNIGEVVIIFLSLLTGLPAPLTATQILLINLVTDGLPATALSIDPFEPDAMKRKPRRRDEKIQTGLGNFLVVYPVLMTLVALAFFVVSYNKTGNLDRSRTLVFLTVVFFEIFQSFASRSTIFPSIKVGVFKNRALVGATASSLIVAAAAVYIPSMNTLFGTVHITVLDFLMVFLSGSIGFVYLETSKLIKSRRSGRC
jgi:Ca2+-transporting ATPase